MVPHNPEHYHHTPDAGAPGTPANDHETTPPEPDGAALYDYALHSLIDRMILIGDHLDAIEADQADIAHRQDVITHHFHAVKHLLERALP